MTPVDVLGCHFPTVGGDDRAIFSALGYHHGEDPIRLPPDRSRSTQNGDSRFHPLIADVICHEHRRNRESYSVANLQ